MRAPARHFLLATVCLGALAAHAASSGSLALPPSVPAPDDWASPHLPKLLADTPVLAPTEQIDLAAMMPKDLLLSIATIPPAEASTPAQLEARLAAYVGTWRGESTWYSTDNPKILHFPTEMVYRFVEVAGRRVLACTITYLINGAPAVSYARLWVESGCIVSEVTQDGQPLRYIARTAQENLVWRATNSTEAALDFGEVETLRLTVDGGELTTQGFEVRHGVDVDAFVHESSDLKLVK